MKLVLLGLAIATIVSTGAMFDVVFGGGCDGGLCVLYAPLLLLPTVVFGGVAVVLLMQHGSQSRWKRIAGHTPDEEDV